MTTNANDDQGKSAQRPSQATPGPIDSALGVSSGAAVGTTLGTVLAVVLPAVAASTVFPIAGGVVGAALGPITIRALEAYLEKRRAERSKNPLEPPKD
jgi:hypothetical protein